MGTGWQAARAAVRVGEARGRRRIMAGSTRTTPRAGPVIIGKMMNAQRGRVQRWRPGIPSRHSRWGAEAGRSAARSVGEVLCLAEEPLRAGGKGYLGSPDVTPYTACLAISNMFCRWRRGEGFDMFPAFLRGWCTIYIWLSSVLPQSGLEQFSREVLYGVSPGT